MKKLQDINPIKIGTILGYECYISDTHYNHLSFLKKGCPVWIKANNTGECEIMVLSKGYAYSEIANYIKHNLPKRKGYYCIKPNTFQILSCQLLNEEGKICAEILVDTNMHIKSIMLGSAEENDLLRDYFLMDYNIKGYESATISIPQEYYVKANKIFNVLTDNGYYIQLG